MKALINNKIYKVNHGWEVDIRDDEQFSSGTIAIQNDIKFPFNNNTYANIWESNDSYLEFIGSASTNLPIDTLTSIRNIYIDIDLTTDNANLISFGNSQLLSMDNGKLVFENATQKSETGVVLTTGRQKIMVSFFSGRFELFVNGIEQVLTTPSNYVDSLVIEDIAVGGSNTNYKLYDLRLTASTIDKEDVLEIVNDNYNIDIFMDYGIAEYVYTDFKEDFTVGITWGIKNLGSAVLGDLGQFQLGIFPVKEWNFYTRAPKSIWFDREENKYQQVTPLIELTNWFTEIKTPLIDLSNPLNGTPKFTGIQDMIDNVYDVAFPEFENVNVGFAYTQELLNAMVGVEAFDIVVPDGNLLSSLKPMFDKLNGRVTITKIENGQITIGIRFKSKANNVIEFNDYDGYESLNPAKGYGTMGESRGVNVSNNSEADNKNAYLYTEDTAISFRSETVDITEDNMITQLFYPIEYIDSVIFYELDNPTNTVDLTPFVVLDSEWKLLLSSGFSTGSTAKWRQNTLQYSKGGTSIFGWSGRYDRFLLWNFRTWQEVIKSAQNLAAVPVNVPSSWEDVSVVVNYRTRNDRKLIRVAKEDISTVNKYSTLQTNQSGNIVNSKVLAGVLHSDIQSSGNRTTIYNKSAFESINDIHELNDLDILTNSLIKAYKLTGYEKTYDIVYTLTQDYQSITDNLDISAKVRQYNIPQGTDSLRFYEDYIEWNLEGIENKLSSLTDDGIEAFMNTFGRTTAIAKKNVDNVEMVSAEIVDEDGNTQSLIIPIDTDGYRNTMEFYFGFDDPTFAYDKKKTEAVGTVGARVSQGIRYTDGNGLLDTVELNYGKKYTATDSITIDKLPVADVTKYTGNPLIKFGTVTSYTTNKLQPLVYNGWGTEVPSDALVQDITIPIDKPISNTVGVDFLFSTNGVGTFTNTEITVKVVTLLDVLTSLGTFTFTPNENLNVPIGGQVKSIVITTDIQFTKPLGTVLDTVIQTSYQEQTAITSGGLKLALGISENLKHTYFLHNVFYKQTNTDIGEIIIGDEAMVNNMLVGGNTKNLFVYESDRYDKATEREFVKGSAKGSVSGLITYTTQSMECLAVIANGNAWAIGDTTTGKLLFAVNPPRDVLTIPQPVRKTVSHNHVHFRTGLVRDY